MATYIPYGFICCCLFRFSFTIIQFFQKSIRKFQKKTENINTKFERARNFEQLLSLGCAFVVVLYKVRL